MYKKIGKTLASLPNIEMHIAGYRTDIHHDIGNISLYPIFEFKRLGFGRFWASWKYYNFLLKVKPQIIIANSYEVLPVSILYKILFGCKIIYDVQENYYRNIAFGNTFPPVIRTLVAAAVRFLEKSTKPFISLYLLAERNYENEFTFSRNKSIIIENKYLSINRFTPPKPITINSKPVKFIFSGTISELYGVFEAIQFVTRLNAAGFDSKLTIIGYSPDKNLIHKVKTAIKNTSFINLKGGDHPVNHQDIISEIELSDVALLPYKDNPSIRNCIPTKFYEHLALGKPMIISPNPLWEKVLEPYHAALFFDFGYSDSVQFYTQLTKQTFYSNPPGNEILWENEVSKLKEAFLKTS